MSFNYNRHFSNEFDAIANMQDFHRRINEFQPSGYYYQNEAYYNNSAAYNQNDQAHFFSTGVPPQHQQQYACQKCNFFSNDSQAILAHLNSPFHLNIRIPTAFQRYEPSFNTSTSDDRRVLTNEHRVKAPSDRINSSHVIKKKSLSHINEPHISNQKIVDESDCIIWLDNDQNKVNQPTIKLRSANNKTDRNQVLNNADNEIRNVDRSDANVINLSSDEENSQSKSALAENQQPHCPESQLQAQVQSCQTGVGNKKFKCVKCRFRSNWSESVNRHFTRAHFHVAFNHQQCLQVLDEDEAARTLPAYEQHLNNKGLECKPFKCGMCEYRATQKPHAFFHMRQVHQVTSHEAQRLVEVLPLDEAKNTVKDYNKKFATETGRCCSKLLLEREGATKNSKSTASTVNQSIYTKVLNKKFKCVICQYRSNWPKSVLKHFKVAHPQVVLSHLKRYTELDEDEATRTLNAYEKIRVGRNFIDKPFQCRLCEYRAAQKTNAYTHIRKVHQVEFCEAKKLLKVLPLDEANKTVGDYNQKVAGRESLSVSASINSCATISL